MPKDARSIILTVGITAGSPFALNQFAIVTAIAPSPTLSGSVNLTQAADNAVIFGGTDPTAGVGGPGIRGIGLNRLEPAAFSTGTINAVSIGGGQTWPAGGGGDGSIAIGQGAIIGTANAGVAVAIGQNARADASSIAIGNGSVALGNFGTAINVSIGSSGATNATASGLVCIGCAGSAIASSRGTYIVGRNTVNVGDGCAIGVDGNGPNITGAGGIAIGNITTAVTGTDGIAIGRNATAAANGIALGASAAAGANTCVIGSTAAGIGLNLFPTTAGVGFQIDASVTADDIRMLVWDVTAALLKRVSRGAVDSGGVGFRLLRVAN